MKYLCSTGTVGTGVVSVVAQYGRMKCYERDAYHVGKQLRPTPHLAHVIFYLFIHYIFDLFSD